MSSADFVCETAFPTSALVPKVETGVLNFLQKYPEYNGRDVIIAILDSGVDPRASGLETLTDGKTVKVIERFDCTGCGDVDVSKKVTANADGFITGLSGRQLKLTPQMISANTANGEYRLGLKSLWDLCYTKVRDNMIQEVRRKQWDSQHKTAVAEVTRKLTAFEAQNSDVSKLPYDKKLIKDDIDYTLEMLNTYEKNYNDIRTTYDCILYATEQGWQAVIDITEKGDLENALHIGEYSKTHDVKNVDNYLSVSMNVHDEGDVLEIVGMCSSHGTHVASIASGNHKMSDLNGVAPEAKIVSLTIGDGRLGSMETGTALVRAMMKIMEMCRTGRKIDVINMSYGEHAQWSNMGRIGELMCEVVNKYGVVWVASAGNHGPALCTVGTPPDVQQPCCIGVGAYISPQMMEAEYVMREKLPANVYTWTSRDPCIDGGQGVTVCAPGGAITSVPQCTLSKSQLMNGTSMAAPHVAGAIALLISGLKQKNIPYSPFSIKRAICATATKLAYVDSYAQGSGLLNVEKAFEHLAEHSKAAENLLRYSIRCGIQNAKGIFIRESFLDKMYEFNVNIEPRFMNDKEVAPELKYNYNVRLNLVSSHPFVQCGAFLDLTYSTRALLVKVDPTGLGPGVHSAVIRAYDTDCIQKGSLFEIPVTVFQPYTLKCDETRIFEPTSNQNDKSIEFQPNTIKRDFILVPKHATWAVLRMRSTDENRNKDVGKFFVHTLQLLPRSSCRRMETMKIVSVPHDINDIMMGFPCQENNILELCIAKYWSNYGLTHLKYSLEFHGIQAINPDAYSMHAGRGIHKLEVTSLSSEEIMPQISLKTATVALKPNEAKISALSPTRDVIPEGRQIYQMVLTYTLSVAKSHEVSLYTPAFNFVLYESEYESQLWMIFDSNKMMVASGDAHSHKFQTKLEKGDYTIKLQVRHEKREMLEKIAEVNMLAGFKLSNSISLDVYDHYNQCIIGGRKFNQGLAKANAPKVLYVGLLSQEKLSKANLPSLCAWLGGSVSFAKDELGRKSSSRAFTYIFGPNDLSKKNGNGSNNSSKTNSATNITTATPVATPPAVPSSAGDCNNSPAPANSSPRKNKTVDDYEEGLRDYKCSMISKCDLEQADKIYEEVIAAHPKHLLAHLQLIQAIESLDQVKVQHPFTFVKSLNTDISDNIECKQKQDADLQKLRVYLERIVQLADIVIKETDRDALLAFLGLKYDSRPDATKIKSNMDKQKGNLIEALVKKGIALGKLGVLDNNLKDREQQIEDTFTEIIKFADGFDPKVTVLPFAIWHAYTNEHYGRMAKYLMKLHDEKRIRENLEELLNVADTMKYDHLKTVIERCIVTSYPHTYRLF